MDYRTEPPESKVLRLQDELTATRKDHEKLKRRLWVLTTVVLGAVPPALVFRFHVPSRILLLDVVALIVWGVFILRVAKHDHR